MTAKIKPSAFEPLSTTPAQAPGTGKPVRWIILITAPVFVAIMAFLLSAKSLQINVVALSPAEVELSGGMYLPFGGRYLLRPGDFHVLVTAQGYHTLSSDITISDKDSQILELVLQALPGRLTLASQPPTAKIFIDATLVGHTPVENLPVEAGRHLLRVEAERYLPREQDLEVTGRDIQQQLNIVLEPAWANITINSQPPGADILLTEEPLGTTPAVVQILQGEAEISLHKEGFASWKSSVSVTAGTPQDLGTIVLQAAAGVVQLNSIPSGANVTVDGEFRGQTPLSLEVTPGRTHRLAVFKAGYKRHSTSIEMEAGETASRTIKLSAQLGEVRFNIAPANAQLKINGKTQGKGSTTLNLPAVAQSIEVSLAGYATVKARVTPRQGLQQVVNITLQTAREAQLSRIKPEVTTSLGQTLLLFSPDEHGRTAAALPAHSASYKIAPPVAS